MNIQEVRTAARSPWQNAYVERVIGSIRRECVDHTTAAENLLEPMMRRYERGSTLPTSNRPVED